MQSNVCLDVGKGATIRFSDRFEDYLPAVLIRWEGRECYNLSSLIYAKGYHYFGSGRFFILAGKTFAEMMLDLLRK